MTDPSLLPHLFIQSFIDNQYGLYIFLLSLGLSLNYIYFVARIIPALAIGNSFRLASVTFCTLLPSFCFLSTALFLDTVRCFMLLLYFAYPSPRAAISPKSPGSFYWSMVFRNQDLGAGSACCYWSITASRPLQRTELGYVSICSELYIHKYL